MSKSSIEVPDIGTVFVTKKRGMRTMRLRVDTKGQVQVSLPWVVPRKTALDFIMSKREWIKQQQTHASVQFYNGMLLGKNLQLIIREKSSSSRIKQDGKYIIVPFNGIYDPFSDIHNKKIEKAILTALRSEAERVLQPRLREFAENYGFNYRSSSIKQLTGRWGSCDSNGHILLSLFLIQLPIELIDYVLIHELAHTRHMNHSPEFWALVEGIYPDYKQARRRMRGMQPRIYDAKAFMA